MKKDWRKLQDAELSEVSSGCDKGETYNATEMICENSDCQYSDFWAGTEYKGRHFFCPVCHQNTFYGVRNCNR